MLRFINVANTRIKFVRNYSDENKIKRKKDTIMNGLEINTNTMHNDYFINKTDTDRELINFYEVVFPHLNDKLYEGKLNIKLGSINNRSEVFDPVRAIKSCLNSILLSRRLKYNREYLPIPEKFIHNDYFYKMYNIHYIDSATCNNSKVTRTENIHDDTIFMNAINNPYDHENKREYNFPFGNIGVVFHKNGKLIHIRCEAHPFIKDNNYDNNDKSYDIINISFKEDI